MYKTGYINILHSLFLMIAIGSYSSIVFSKTITLENADFKAINEKLELHLELEPLEYVTGYYNTQQGQLHGKFDLGEEYTGHNIEQDAFYLYKNKVQGSFEQGKKNGEWLYSHVFDDGLNAFERHEITIHYKNGKCIKSSFNGVIGHIMPITNHVFSDPEFCTPSNIRDEAWRLWSEHYNETTRQHNITSH